MKRNYLPFLFLLGAVFFLSACGDGTTIPAEKNDVFGQENPLAPLIQLEGDNPYHWEVCVHSGSWGNCGDQVFEEPGFEVTHYQEDDLGQFVEIDQSALDLGELGTYQILYSVEDSQGRETFQARDVIVKDTTSPILSLEGEDLTGDNFLERTCSFNEPGVTAEDNYHGLMSQDQIEVSTALDVTNEGEYEVEYTAKDSSGNESAPKIREVEVIDTQEPELQVSLAQTLPSNDGSFHVLGDAEIDAYDVACNGTDAAEDLTTEVEVSLAEGETQGCSGGLSDFPVIDLNQCEGGDQIYLTYEVSDVAGNTSTKEENFTITDVFYDPTQLDISVNQEFSAQFVADAEILSCSVLEAPDWFEESFLDSNCDIEGIAPDEIVENGYEDFVIEVSGQQENGPDLTASLGVSVYELPEISFDPSSEVVSEGSGSINAEFELASGIVEDCSIVDDDGLDAELDAECNLSVEAPNNIEESVKDYTVEVSATNPAGGVSEENAEFGLTVHALPEISFQPSSKNVGVGDTNISTSLVTESGAVESCSIEDDGGLDVLNFDEDCELLTMDAPENISGGLETFTVLVSAENAIGGQSPSDAVFELTVFALPEISFETSELESGVSFEAVADNEGGPVTDECSSEDVPEDWSVEIVDETTCKVTGTAPLEPDQYSYEISASNDAGSDTTSLVLSVEAKSIETAAALQEIHQNLNAHYVLESNIELTESWTPIGQDEPFEGHLDGQYYTIEGLNINNSDSEQLGLFSVIGESGVVKNLYLKDVSLYGLDQVGAVAGFNQGEIKRVGVLGSSEIQGSSSIGGLVGKNKGDMNECFVEDALVEKSDASGMNHPLGGLVGVNEGSIENSYFLNEFSSPAIAGRSPLGGLVGKNEGSIKDTYVVGELDGFGLNQGCLVGEGNDSNVIESYWDENFCSLGANGAGGVGLDTLDMYEEFEAWDFENIWKDVENPDDYHMLQWDSDQN